MKTQFPHLQITVSIHSCLFANTQGGKYTLTCTSSLSSPRDMIFAQRRGMQNCSYFIPLKAGANCKTEGVRKPPNHLPSHHCHLVLYENTYVGPIQERVATCTTLKSSALSQIYQMLHRSEQSSPKKQYSGRDFKATMSGLIMFLSK